MLQHHFSTVHTGYGLHSGVDVFLHSYLCFPRIALDKFSSTVDISDAQQGKLEQQLLRLSYPSVMWMILINVSAVIVHGPLI